MQSAIHYTQQKGDKNKIYSTHEPEVGCIANGKETKKLEFGNKSGIVLTKSRKLIITDIFLEGKASEVLLELVELIFGKKCIK